MVIPDETLELQLLNLKLSLEEREGIYGRDRYDILMAQVLNIEENAGKTKKLELGAAFKESFDTIPEQFNTHAQKLHVGIIRVAQKLDEDIKKLNKDTARKTQKTIKHVNTSFKKMFRKK